MLTRAARRRHTLRYIQNAAEQLQLPWLCPALSRPHTTSPQQRPIATRSSSPRRKPNSALSLHARHLASAAPVVDNFDRTDSYLPFYKSDASSRTVSKSVSANPHVDLSKILMIDNTTSLPPERLDTNRTIGVDIRGNALEIEATLEACLQVHRWDRALSILKQLRILYQANPSKLQEAYNRVLEAMVFDHIWNRTTRNLEKINNWVEVDMRRAGLEPNAQTFALKIKIALATLSGSRRDRTVRRYWEYAKEYQFENQVASLRHILSDSDLGKLTEICPLKVNFNLEPEFELDGEEIATQEDVISQALPPMVRETTQKGLGMTSLKQSLSLFSNARHLDEWQQVKNADENTREAYARTRQAKLEEDSLQSAMDRWKQENEKMVKMGISGNLTNGKIGALLWQWHEGMTAKLLEELENIEQAEAKTKKTADDRLRCEYGPFLRLLEPPRIAALTTISAIQIMSKSGVTNSIKLARLVTEVGRNLESEVDAQMLKNRELAKKRNPQDHQATQKPGSEPIPPERHHPEVRTFSRNTYWTSAIHAKVGAILSELLFETAKINITKEDVSTGKKVSLAQPVFHRQMVFQHGRKVGLASLHSDFADMLVSQPAADTIAKQLPMVSKPRPWTGFREGGYLESRQEVLRVKHADTAQREYAQAAANRGDLDQLFAGLDVLGSTGWRINKDVFGVMLDAWNSGEGIANLPPLEKIFPELPKPAENAEPKAKFEWYQKLRAMNNEKSGLHSNRCFQNFQMEIARAYLEETFYLPHNVDFRGRAYPIPPYLNQMGADNARGLLLFDQGRELGPDGLKWLKVQLANVFGYDKASLTDRAQFATDHFDDIMDSVNNPLNGKRWWLTAEDPWQCLAACHELKNALESPNPELYISHLPIHQDGTCNGLQHYAALGGDIAGARQVNLEPGDKPADVYTGVAELVKAEIKHDASAGMEIAKLLDGKITRKIVKQTVMTNVYGVTFTGAIRQVRKQVDDLLPELNEQKQAGPAATYIAKKIFKGLGTLFEGAHDIQYWLGDCANRITNSLSPAQLELISAREANGGIKLTLTERGNKTPIIRRKRSKSKKLIDSSDFRSTVIWTTPLKLPVVQPYRINHARSIKTNLQNISLAEPSVADAVDGRKQLQGFPPNFIHSLDATHMMLSALKADEHGISFSAVHDSFWTHAADINTLNRLLRDAFIRMHSEDIVGRLAAEFKMRYRGHLYLAKIDKGSKLAKEITAYRLHINSAQNGESKTTSKKPTEAKQERRYVELVKEIKRQKLLASDDPKERQEGVEMITAGSLFEKHGGEKYLCAKNSLGETALGKIPEANAEAIEEALTHDEELTHDVNMHDTLAPLMQAAVDAEELTTVVDKSEVVQAERSTTQNSTTANRKKKAKQTNTSNQNIWLWLPLSFKTVPKKGDFDVERLRDSTYFFS